MMLGEIPVEVLATKSVQANTPVSHFVPAAYPALPEGSLAAPPLGLVNITIRAASRPTARQRDKNKRGG